MEKSDKVNEIANIILNGKTVLGIELGTTRIKSVLTDSNNKILAAGGYEWENRYVNNLWTYSLEDIWSGVQGCYKDLADNVKKTYGITLATIGAIGVSAMMHGYMVFDKEGKLLTPFRTWRNNNAEYAANELTKLFNYHIPARWSIAHLYQAILNGEDHVSDIAFQTTLEGYIHWKLTGRRVIGIGEASGMFPIDTGAKTYNKKMVGLFESAVSAKKLPWKLKDILPQILVAGNNAGTLTAEGAKLLDVSCNLQSGIPFCPPEGDAGTGMVATNCIKKQTANVSAGTSVFSMIVLEKELSKAYPEIDLVTTPAGDLVAMVHCNNCSSDINCWMNVFDEFAKMLGVNMSKNDLYEKMFNKALEGGSDCGEVLVYNYLSGEHITDIKEGRPMVLRTTESRFSLANFMRAQLYSSMITLKLGLDILFKEEKIKVKSVLAHGGLFKTKDVCQKFLAAIMEAPVTVTPTAGEGGAWGMAVLASYMLNKKENETLEEYLDNSVFKGQEKHTIYPENEDIKGIGKYLERFKSGLNAEKEALTALKG